MFAAESRERSLRDWLESTNSIDCIDSFNEKRLAHAALIVERMRQAVKQQTGFNCSAGISHNKVLGCPLQLSPAA